MKKWAMFLYMLLMISVVLSACGANKVGVVAAVDGIDKLSDLYKTQMETTVSIKGTNDGVSEFFPFEEYPLEPGETCYNITPDYISDNSDFKIFKYDKSCRTFLVYDNENVLLMGGWFGGFGVMDMKLADVDNDGIMELYFTFSWGSGIHRSEVGYFNPKAGEVIVFDYSHINRDMMLISDESGNLSIHETEIIELDSFVEFTMKANGHIDDIVFKNNTIELSEVTGESDIFRPLGVQMERPEQFDILNNAQIIFKENIR